MSQFADARGALDNDTFKLSWRTDIGLAGEATLPRSKATDASELVANEMTWDEFQSACHRLELDDGQFLFRGQGHLGAYRLLSIA